MVMEKNTIKKITSIFGSTFAFVATEQIHPKIETKEEGVKG